MRNLTNTLLLSYLFLLGCSKDKQEPARPDVYVVGRLSVYVNSNEYVYWKNGAASSFFSFYPSSITVSGSDVYISGTEFTWPVYHGVSWKNGVATPLRDGSSNTTGYATAVSGNDVYVVGGTDTLSFTAAMLWKNGVAQHLGGINTTSIALSGADVYVAGNLNKGYFPLVYWKNGAVTKLPMGGGEAADIAVSGSDVYMTVGFGGHSPYEKWLVWKNGVTTELTDGTRRIFVTSLAVSGTDVYVTGNEYIGIGTTTKALYWKNGIETTLAEDGAANGMMVSGTDVYIAGGDQGDAVYWKNGVATQLGFRGVGNAIFVK
jgi:hypothetical protein